ncbi:MAG: hypothetical protein ABIG55_05980 [Candidatus Omnitrophota bacterium]|nr:hypothetical protein [Candidatus Omnitrophota bacterium]
MGPQKYKRKKYMILMKFQMKYILYILLFLYVGALVAGYTVYWTTWVTLGEKLASVYPRGRLIYIFRHANMVLLWRLLLITPVFVFIGIRLSHRIAGPVYRIGMYIDSLLQRDYSKGLKLRKKDELKILAAKMDQLCAGLRADQEKRASVVKDVVGELENKGLDSSALDNVKAKLEGIK